MKIQLSSLISDAKKIAAATDSRDFANLYSLTTNKSTKPLKQKIDLLKQQLFTLQSNISENQTFSEGLIKIQKELIKLWTNYNRENLEQFYHTTQQISITFSYANKNIIAENYLKPIFEKKLKKEHLSLLETQITHLIKGFTEQIRSDNRSILKLHISSENIRAASTINNTVFHEVKSKLGNSTLEMLNKIHTISSSSHVSQLLS